jgi:hypothetical protein
MERIHHHGESCKLSLGPCWSLLDDGGIEGIQIQPDVDAIIRKRRHAAIMIGVCVDMVHTDRVHANGRHGRRIEGALRGVHEGVARCALVCYSCWVSALSMKTRSIRTFDKELLPIGEELGAFRSNRKNGINRSKSEACERKEREQMHSERFSKFKIDNISHRKNSKNCALIDKETIYQSMLMIEKRRKVNATLEKTFIQSPPALLPSQSLRSTEPHSSDRRSSSNHDHKKKAKALKNRKPLKDCGNLTILNPSYSKM